LIPNGSRRTLSDGLRLAVGTLTRVPTPPPRQITRGCARIAMLLAPLVGLLLCAGAALPLLLTGAYPGLAALTACGAVLLVAWGSRALHLDGLADTADALGSRAPVERALQIARQSDIGPFGVVAIVAALLLQIIALGSLSLTQPVPFTFWVAVVCIGGARAAITVGCTPWFPPARPDGLGATVARCVPRSAALLTWLLLIGLGWLLLGPVGAIALAAAAGAAVLTLLHAKNRLGGMTGDVLGASVEVAATAGLVTACLACQILA